MRNLAKVQNPVVEIQVNGEDVTITTITTFKTSAMKFKLGEEFTENRLDGVEVKVCMRPFGAIDLTQIIADGN